VAQMKRAAVLWTGGKDCNLALYEAESLGYNIVVLISFGKKNGTFLAHPIQLIKLQSEALKIQHESIVITFPYEKGYEDALLYVKNKYNVHTIVTGDIAEVQGNSNWIKERCTPLNLNVLLPLWHLDRTAILNRLFQLNFEVILTCVKAPWFDSSWLGKQLNSETILDFHKINEKYPLDFCGENGEYHTMVLDGPNYTKKIILDNIIASQQNEIIYLDENNLKLYFKNSEAITGL
jgi:diphthine-ammonia ligase